MKKSISLYFRYVGTVLKCTMEYKLSFVLMVTGRFLVAISGFLGIYFLFSGFSEIKGYSYGDVLLCFSILQLSFAMAECIGSGFMQIAGLIKSGAFDRILLRPCSPILQILGMQFNLGRIGAMVMASLVLALGIWESGVEWTAARIGVLILMVLGGVLLFIGIFMVGAAICFFSLEESGCLNVLTYGANEHGKYPIDIYGKVMMQFCTYVIPYTLVQYYPLQYLLGKTNRWQYGLYPFGVVVFFAVCYGIWRFGVKHYKSSGS